jgi:hypothetical protein
MGDIVIHGQAGSTMAGIIKEVKKGSGIRD